MAFKELLNDDNHDKIIFTHLLTIKKVNCVVCIDYDVRVDGRYLFTVLVRSLNFYLDNWTKVILTIVSVYSI